MRITRVRLAHVRAITRLELELDERITALTGRAGTGKTTILDALSVGLGMTGTSNRRFEGRDTNASGNEPAVEIETRHGSNWRRQGLDPTRTEISEMKTADTSAACISVCGRRARPIKPDSGRSAHNPWWRAADAARSILTAGGAGPFDPADGARWSHGQAKTMEMFTRIATGLWAKHRNAYDPLAGAGVALIDDIDAMLHPHTQQLVLPALEHAFPMLQIICSTHSPAVLTTVRPTQIIELTHQRSLVTPRYGAERRQSSAPAGGAGGTR